MTSIAKQNTIEALTIYHKAHVNKWEVRVVDGNVRIASWTDKFSSVLSSIFNPYRKRTDWNEKAKEAITEKLTKEITSLQKETDKDSIKNKVGLLLKNIKKVKKEEIFSSAKTIIFESKDLTLKPKDEEGFEEISLNDAFDNEIIFDAETKKNIEKLWKIKDKKTYNSLIEEITKSKITSLNDAIDIGETTIYLMKNHSLPRSVALNDAKDLLKFSNTLLENKKIEESPDKIEIAYYTKKFMENKGLSTSDAVLCAKSLKGIKAEKKIKTPAAIEIAVTRLNKMKEFQKITPHGLPLNIDGSATEFNLKFSARGEQSIITLLKKPDLEKTHASGVNNAFIRDTNRMAYKFVSKKGEKLLDFKSYIKSNNQEKKQLNQTDIDNQVEIDKKDYQLEVIKQLKQFSNNDEEIYYALSLLCDQGVGISFTRVFTTDFNPENDTLPPDTHIDAIPFQYIGIHADLPANNPGWAKSKPELAAQHPDIVKTNKNDLTTNSLLTIQWMEDQKIRVNFQIKQKINYISDSNRKTFMPLKNSASDYEIESEYTVEYKIDTLRKMASKVKEVLKKNPSSEELKQITLNPDVDFISSKVFMRINPDWESKTNEF